MRISCIACFQPTKSWRRRLFLPQHIARFHTPLSSICWPLTEPPMQRVLLGILQPPPSSTSPATVHVWPMLGTCKLWPASPTLPNLPANCPGLNHLVFCFVWKLQVETLLLRPTLLVVLCKGTLWQKTCLLACICHGRVWVLQMDNFTCGRCQADPTPIISWWVLQRCCWRHKSLLRQLGSTCSSISHPWLHMWHEHPHGTSVSFFWQVILVCYKQVLVEVLAKFSKSWPLFEIAALGNDFCLRGKRDNLSISTAMFMLISCLFWGEGKQLSSEKKVNLNGLSWCCFLKKLTLRLTSGRFGYDINAKDVLINEAWNWRICTYPPPSSQWDHFPKGASCYV